VKRRRRVPISGAHCTVYCPHPQRSRQAARSATTNSLRSGNGTGYFESFGTSGAGFGVGERLIARRFEALAVDSLHVCGTANVRRQSGNLSPDPAISARRVARPKAARRDRRARRRASGARVERPDGPSRHPAQGAAGRALILFDKKGAIRSAKMTADARGGLSGPRSGAVLDERRPAAVSRLDTKCAQRRFGASMASADSVIIVLYVSYISYLRKQKSATNGPGRQVLALGCPASPDRATGPLVAEQRLRERVAGNALGKAWMPVNRCGIRFLSRSAATSSFPQRARRQSFRAIQPSVHSRSSRCFLSILRTSGFRRSRDRLCW
jgi:hypothetical protein